MNEGTQLRQFSQNALGGDGHIEKDLICEIQGTQKNWGLLLVGSGEKENMG